MKIIGGIALNCSSSFMVVTSSRGNPGIRALRLRANGTVRLKNNDINDINGGHDQN
ncbi:MAG: hypothetical protein KGL62_13025 [Bradyrhizobium sp.]|nr:hypothetical protein [Bradyrhizobium sp.]